VGYEVQDQPTFGFRFTSYTYFSIPMFNKNKTCKQVNESIPHQFGGNVKGTKWGRIGVRGKMVDGYLVVEVLAAAVKVLRDPTCHSNTAYSSKHPLHT